MPPKKLKNPHPEEETKQVDNLFVSKVHDESSRSGSKVSGKSRLSVGSRRAKSELAIAQLREQQLVAEVELEKRKLEAEAKLLTARNQTAMAELRVKLSEESESDCQSSINYPDKMAHLERYINDCNSRSGEHEPRQELVDVSNGTRAPIANPPDLPKVELGCFDGNTSDYWKFVKQFEYYVEDRVTDSGQRFLYLMYYCRGRAKLAIEECVMLPPDLAYANAREILANLFGQNHVVARALIDKLTSALKGPVTDPEDLSLLDIRLRNSHRFDTNEV